ncbi:TIGR04168 family protein [Candidatus Gracilibacteria bacterium]|nr:TIGR04168 family protein [Candidatus Gracilibacteria bacterium]NJM88729.1 TIGR04168 family protein [Hydrococcus sp. RU_2_2]NJP21089.1 TIGR04168 family protein [Hydrococcus sp. CRU_1_1]
MSDRSERLIKIAVVGDIHDRWEEEDNLALQHLGVDLALFVGDFGNESVEVVRRIAALEIPKAAIMGNHDAWYSASAWGRKQCPYNREQEDRVQQQIDLLGEAHVGYSKLDFPQLRLSVVGSRPFSWGGDEWKNRTFLRDRYGVNNFEESTAKIVAAATQTAFDTVIFLAHNAPVGLGEAPEDICGRDWEPLGGDHGDPDFADAIARVLASGKTIPLVTFGHMHHQLRHTRSQLRTAVTTTPQGIVYLNAASVPRIIERTEDKERLRNFSVVSLRNGAVEQISLIWVGKDFSVVSDRLLYHRDRPVLKSA